MLPSHKYELVARISNRDYYRNKLYNIEKPIEATLGLNRCQGLQQLTVLANCGLIVEIGVREGYLAEHFIRNCNDSFVYGIDIEHCPNAIAHEKNWPGRYKFIKEDSLVAHMRWPDEWFDFIHLDACHKYNHVKKELAFWWPKLRPGGIISGDDFMRYHCNEEGEFGVIDAVMEFTEMLKIPYYLIGYDAVSKDDLFRVGEYAGRELKRKVNKQSHDFKEPPNFWFQKLKP